MKTMGTQQNNNKTKLTGKVLDASGNPVIGASVMQRGTKNGVITDINGQFVIDVTNVNAPLDISYIGFKTKTVKASNNMEVYLEDDSKVLSDVVVVGYGSQLRRQVTGAISSVKGDDIKAPNAVSADNLLQGKVAGLTITQNSAQPGSSMSVNIRGSLSPNGSNDPLYVIDGVVISSNANNATKVTPDHVGYSLRDGTDRSPLATLNPNDIESIDVLKDASAAAIYGASAANGVILITTKKGKTGKPTLSYNGSVSFQSIGKYYKPLGTQEYMNLCNLGEKERWLYDNRYAPYGAKQAPSSGWPYIYTDSEIASATESYNHIDDITRTGTIYDNNISLTAGSENVKLYSSFNFFDQKSLLKNTDLRRLSGRVNFDAKLSNVFRIYINSMYTVNKANNPSTGHWRENLNEANQVNAALYYNPQIALRNADGTLTKAENALLANPLQFSLIKDKTTTKRLMFTPNLEITMTPWLKGNVQLSVDETDENRDMFSPKAAKMPQQVQDNYGGYSNAYNHNYSVEEYLTFNKKFGQDHALNAVIGSGFYKAKGNSYDLCVFNLPTDALQNNALQLSSDVEDTQYHSYRWERNKLSFFGRLNYTYKDRYIFGTTLRRDGSSAFSKNHKWGWFPGASAAWILSSEDFMKDYTWLDYLKVRAGIGTSGNESILTGNAYTSNIYTTPDGGGFFYFNNKLNNGLIQTVKANNDLKWETDITFNAGFDYSLFHDRLSGSVDYYVRTAKDLLDFATLPKNDIVSSIAKNIGETRSTGIELAFKGLIIDTNDWKLSSYLNLSHNKSHWVKRNPEVSLNPWEHNNDELNIIYGWKTNGIFKSLDEVSQYTSNGKVLQPDAFPGNLKYVDVNGDGVLDEKDIVKLGTWEPLLNYGFGINVSYKNWAVNIDTYGVISQKAKDGWGYRTFLGSSRVNTSTHSRDLWSSFNTDGWYPGIADDYSANANKTGYNDFTLKNMSYMRIKNIKLTYSLPQSALNYLHISNMSVYADLQNSVLLTNYEGLDPEMEHNSAPFPIPRTFVLGLNITF